MGAADILQELKRMGLFVTANGDKVRAGPIEAITEEARALIRAHKSELLALLSHEDTATEMERYRLECWDRFKRAADCILEQATEPAQKHALERYGREVVAKHGEQTGTMMAREMRDWVRFRRGIDAE